MKTHRNIPFFVPHAGCPNCCVFCSQVKITGVQAEKDLQTELAELNSLLQSQGVGTGESQIGFFGGSFTAIERHRMESLLQTANGYIKKGVAESIRISTRPDKIDEDVLDLLAKYGVTHIELGVQSTDESVLNACLRGHTAKDSFNAASLITQKGFTFGGQMMIGLPNATPESEFKTAKDIIKMGAKEARIYPTVVFENTKLYHMAKNGEYTPLSLESAVVRTASCYRLFLEAGVKVLRIGLHASENLANAPMGANHQALGELVKGRVYADIIAEQAGDCTGKILEAEIKKEDISMLRGHGSAATEYIKTKTNAKEVRLIPAPAERFKVKTRSV